LLAPSVLLAGGVDEFYERLYARGMADFRTADYQLAYTELHKAAFGFVEEIEKFETAEVYAAIAANRLGHPGEARDALLRIAAAEDVQPHLRSMTIPDDLRAELLRAAAALLTKKEAAAFGISEEMQDAAAKEHPRVDVPTPSVKPNVAETAPRGAGDANAPDGAAEAQPAAASSTSPPPPAGDPSPASALPSDHPVSKDPPPAAPREESGAQPGKQTIAPMVPPKQQPAKKTIDARLDEAQQAIDNGDPDSARTIYNALLRDPQLPHAPAMRLAEGLYRVRDFAGALRAFRGVGAIGQDEERYHYYYAVALFETRHYRDACRELDLALPFIEVTEDVAGYREKIYRAGK
jgi:tetratricopeptide (TPR) repeat protein